MKTRTFVILLFVFFGLCLLFCRVSLGHNWPGRVDVSYAISLTMLAVGGLIAAISLFVLLQRSLEGQSLQQTMPLIIGLLGGVLLYQVNWGVALALGLIVASAVVAQSLTGRKDPRND